MSSKIFDPLTNQYISNSGDPEKSTTFDPLTGENIETSFIFNNNPLNQKTKVLGESISQNEANSFPSLNPFRTDLEEQEQRALQQSTSDKALNGLAKSGITFTGAVLDNTAGLYVGLVSGVTGGSFVNNPLGQFIDEMNESAQETFPNYQTQEERDSFTFGANFWFDKVLNGAAYSAAAMASVLIPGIGISGLTRNISKAMIKKAANSFAKQSLTNVKNANNAVSYASKTFKSTIAESGVEARQTFNELNKSLKEKALQENNGESLTQEQLDKIKELSTAGMNSNFWTNSVIVGASNMAMFGNIIKNGSSEAFKSLRKKLLVNANGKFEVAPLTIKNSLKTIAKDGLSEAGQEGGQFTSNIAFQDYYTAKFNNDDSADIVGSVLDAAKETFTTKDGLESMLIGAIVGGGMVSFKNVGADIKDKINNTSNKSQEKEQELASILNSESFVQMNEAVKDNARTLKYTKLQNQAIKEDDEAAYHRASFNIFKSNLHSHLRQGTEEIFIEKLNEVKEMDDAEFKQFFGYSEEMSQKLDKNAIIDNYIQQTNTISDIYKNIDFLYGDAGNYNVVELIAKSINKDQNEVKNYYKDILFDGLTTYEYLTNRKAKLSEEIKNLSNNTINYNNISVESTEEFFKTIVEQLDNAEISPIKKKQIRSKVKELKDLEVSTEVNNAVLNKLENLKEPSNKKRFTKEVKDVLNTIENDFQTRLKNKLEKAEIEIPKKKKETKEQVKNQNTTNPNQDNKVDIINEVEEFEKEEVKKAAQITDTIGDMTAFDKKGSKFNAVNSYLKKFFKDHPSLIERELENINRILGTNLKDSKSVIDEVSQELMNKGVSSKEIQDLFDFYVNRGKKISNETTSPTIDNKQSEPDLESIKDINDTTEDYSTKGYPVNDNESKLITDTLDIRESSEEGMKVNNPNASLPLEFDEVIATLNDPEAIPIGSKIYIEYPANSYNQKASRPQLFAYVLTENGRVNIGLIGGKAQKNTPVNEFTEKIFEQVKNRKGETEIDLNLVITKKLGSKFNNTNNFINPTNIQKVPRFAIGVYKNGIMSLNTNGLKDILIDYVPGSIEEGHTYMLMPTTQREDNKSNGRIIHRVAKLFTKKLSDIDPSYKEKVLKLLLESKKEGTIIENKPKVNEIIFLNYDIRDSRFIDIYDYSAKSSPKRKRLTFDITDEESIFQLSEELDNKVTKIDITQINAGNYNKKVSDQGRLKTNLDPILPMYNTQFIIGSPKKKVNISYTPSTSISTDTSVKNNTSTPVTKKEPVKPSNTSAISASSLVNKPSKNKIPKARTKTNFTKGNNETELSLVQRMLPNQQITISEDISRIANLGEEVWGLFLNGVIYLDKNFSKGTAYHEAFHAVFNSYLSNEEKQKLFTEAQIKYGTFNLEQKIKLNNLYKNKNLTDTQLEDIWLEEQLAEEFRRYTEGIENKSLSQKIKSFFKKLWDLITFTKNNSNFTESIFQEISKGTIGQRSSNIRFNNTPMLRERLTEMNQSESKYAVELVNQIFQAIVDQHIQQSNDEGKTLSDTQAINELNINNSLYQTIYDSLHSDYQTEEDPDIKELFRKMLINFKNGNEFGNLVKLHKAYYRVNNYITIKDNVKELTSQEQANLNEFENADDIPSWLQSAVEKSGKFTLSQKLKKKLVNLRTKEVSPFGYYEYTNFSALYNTMEKGLSNLLNYDLMRNKLDELANFYPELKSFSEDLDNDKQLQAQFFTHFAKGQNSYLTFKVDKNPKTGVVTGSIINNSRKNVASEILTNLESNLLNSKLFNVEGKIDQTLATKYQNTYNKEINKLKEFLDNSNDIIDEDFTSLSKILTNFYKLPISKELLHKFYTSSGNEFNSSFINETSTIKSFINILSKGGNPFIGKKKLLNDIVDIVEKGRLNNYQDSIMNGEGKMQYSHVVPNFIQKQLSRLNNGSIKFIESLYGKDKSYDGSYILNEVTQGRIQEVFVGDNTQKDNESKGTRFSSYSATDYELASINGYINQPIEVKSEEGSNKGSSYKKKPEALYQFPVTSDAPVNYFLKGKKFTIEESLDNLYNLFLFEKNRIRTNRVIENYQVGNYEILPFFNNPTLINYNEDGSIQEEIKLDLDSNQVEDIDNIKKFIEQNMNLYFEEYLETLKESETISINEQGEIVSDYIDSRSVKTNDYPNMRSLLREYLYASTYMTADMVTVFAGDPSFAKANKKTGSKITDLNKRLREISTPYAMLMPINEKQTFNTLFVLDDKRKTIQNEFYKAVTETFPKTGRLKLLEETVDNTDGQSFITLERWKHIKQATGEWNTNNEESFKRLQTGNELQSDLDLVVEPIKGFYFGLHNDSSGKVVPIQKKDSEVVLLPSMGKNNSKLQNLLDRMYTKGNYENQEPVEIISFSSTIKKGGTPDNLVNTFDDLTKQAPVVMNYSDYGIQQPSPEKHLDKEINFGTQFRKLLIANLSGEYKLPGFKNEDISSNEIKSIYEKFIINNLKESSIKTLASMGYDIETDTIDNNKLKETLVKELDNGDFGPEYREALEVLNDDTFKIDLWNPMHAHRIESLLNSMLKNKITKQKIKGATFVNASNYLVENDDSLQVKMGTTEDGQSYVESFEVIVPAWSKDIMRLYMNDDGSIKDTMPQELRELVGYRIPTEAKYSMTKVYIKGFSNQASQSVIYAPTEIIQMTGLDFDIDKMFFMIPEHEISLDGQDIRYIHPNYEDLNSNNRKQRNNGIIEIAKSILSASQTFNEQSSPGSFKNLQNSRNEIVKLKGSSTEFPTFALPYVQRALFERNRDAGKLIGVFANNVTSNGMLQYEGLELPEDLQFIFDDKIIKTLDQSGIELSRSLATLVAASVDAVKDPVFFELNINSFTGNILATMIRMGVDEKTALYMLNNKVIVDLAKKANKLRYTSPQEVNKIFDELLKTTQEGKVELNQDALKSNINDNNSKVNNQILKDFQKFYDISQDVNTLTTGTKLDAKPPGALMSNNEVTIRKVNKIKEGLTYFPNSSKIFSESSNYPLINAFYEETYKKPTDNVLTKLFPWVNNSFADSKTYISDQIGGELSAESINKINNSAMTYLYSNEDNLYISPEKNQYLRTKFYNEIQKFKSNIPNGQEYLILEMLDFDKNDKLIKFRNTTKLDSYTLTSLKDSWTDLYYNNLGTEFESLATDLFMYNFSINGFVFSNISFSHLAPEVIYTDFVKNDLVKPYLDIFNTEPFVQQYIRNNFDSLQLTQISKDNKEVLNNANKKVVNGKVVQFEATDKLSNGIIEDMNTYPLYVKNYSNDILFQRVGDEFNSLYVAIPKLGNKFSKEYKFGEMNLKTIHKANKIDLGDKVLASMNIEAGYGINLDDYQEQFELPQQEIEEEINDELILPSGETKIITQQMFLDGQQRTLNNIQEADISDELKEELVTLTNSITQYSKLGEIHKKICK